MGHRINPHASRDYSATAFQAYQPGATYQATSQYPTDQRRNPSSNQLLAGGRSANHNVDHMVGNHDNDMIDTADESDVVSIKPSKARSGNTFTVKKVSLFFHFIVTSYLMVSLSRGTLNYRQIYTGSAGFSLIYKIIKA